MSGPLLQNSTKQRGRKALEAYVEEDDLWVLRVTSTAYSGRTSHGAEARNWHSDFEMAEDA